MARIRTIKPEFWGDEKLAPCSPITRLVFLGLISMADDAGRVVDNVKVIDAFVFPETSETCRGSIDELSAMGRIRRGKTASGQRIIERHKQFDMQYRQSEFGEWHRLEAGSKVFNALKLAIKEAGYDAAQIIERL